VSDVSEENRNDKNAARALLEKGRTRAAKTAFEGLVTRHPDDAEVWHFLAVCHGMLGTAAEAERCLRQAIDCRSRSPHTFFNLGNILMDQGKFSEAVMQYQAAIEIKLDFADAYTNMGLALARQGRLQEAGALYEKALGIEPDHLFALNNLGLAHTELGQLDLARDAFDKALRLDPNSAEVHNNLGLLFVEQGWIEKAIACYQRAVALKGNYASAYTNLGVAFERLGRTTDALRAYEDAVQADPNYATAHYCLGNALRAQDRIEEAVAHYREALRHKPDYAEAHNNLGIALAGLGHLDEALDLYRHAIAINPGYTDAHHNLGQTLLDQGRQEDAINRYRRALRIRPESTATHTNLLFALHCQADYDGKAACADYQDWNRIHTDPLKKQIVPHTNDRSGERRLRIGYVSNDFRNHVTNFFFEPVLESHGSDRFEIFCYDTNLSPDTVTQRLQSLAHHWRCIAGLSDEVVAQQIREDKIDILVDLKGHTENHRLLIFARKPAPVQVTWLGYPNTTGMSVMDYWITDRNIASQDMTDQYHTEELIRMPDFYMCFRPGAGGPDINPLPALTNGYITFGSFNTFFKITPKMLRLWAEILKAVPDSRLLIAAVPEGTARDRLLTQFTLAGIETNRLMLEKRLSHDKFLRLHHKVDIALDAFPYHGTTTTLHDLWMGVPVITLAGRAHVSRVGHSILTNLGLSDFIARSPEQYVLIAVRLAGELDYLNTLRAELRQRMSTSPLMDAPRFTRHLEAAYREMWRRWCESQCTA
jgi:predicted O-linked N-acetylglucosamine transferase (SPINDLY family)